MDKEVKLLELGVASGKSMQMWQHYLVNGTIRGLDLFPQYQPGEGKSRVRMYQGP
jgi:hypothetical protein